MGCWESNPSPTRFGRVQGKRRTVVLSLRPKVCLSLSLSLPSGRLAGQTPGGGQAAVPEHCCKDDTPPATTQRLSPISFLLPAGGAAFIFPNTSVYPEATQRISSRPGMTPSRPPQVICLLPGIWGWGDIVLLRPCGLSHEGHEGAAYPGSQVKSDPGNLTVSYLVVVETKHRHKSRSKGP